MRIALLTKQTLAHGLGGLQVHAEELARGLCERAHEVVVVTTSLPGQPAVVCRDGVEIHFLPGTRSGVYSRSWWRESAVALERLEAEQPFDLVVSEDLAGASDGYLRHVPHLPILHGFTLDHLVSEFRQIQGATGALKYPAIKIPELTYYALARERPLVVRARRLGVVNRRVMGLIRRWYRVPEEALRLLPPWVDVDRFRPDPSLRREVRSAHEMPSDAFVFLMASVLTKQKGLQVGLEAFAQCCSKARHPFLLIVGDGPYRPALVQQARALGANERVRFVGAVAPTRMPTYYQAADAFLFPSLRIEGLPYVVLEAMASALPVIASWIGGVPEAIGNAGFLVRPGDTQELAQSMVRLLDAPRLATGTGQAARERAMRLYASDVVLARVEEVCRELVEAARPAVPHQAAPIGG
ncbi:MAG: glycosyltransferase family 4 protein [Candidatus Rokubacteria bacterium]|nr:glycosyltransferase family 4 protein [Candidatus Rokubacteria bacterium]